MWHASQLCRSYSIIGSVAALASPDMPSRANVLFVEECLFGGLQRQHNSNSKAPRSSQRVSSPTRKRQCNGLSHDDLDNGAAAEQEAEAEAQTPSKRSDSGRVDLQAVAAGV